MGGLKLLLVLTLCILSLGCQKRTEVVVEAKPAMRMKHRPADERMSPVQIIPKAPAIDDQLALRLATQEVIGNPHEKMAEAIAAQVALEFPGKKIGPIALVPKETKDGKEWFSFQGEASGTRFSGELFIKDGKLQMAFLSFSE